MMYNPTVEIPAEDFILTSTGNIISRKAEITQPKRLEVPGGRVFIDQQAHIHSDIAPIQLQRYVYVSQHAVLRPSQTVTEPQRAVPMTVGSHSFIGAHSVVHAAAIGVGCHVGSRCTIGERCILKDYVKVLDDAVLSNDMVVPPFSIVAGSPARIVAEQSESVSTLAAAVATDRYKAVKAVNKQEQESQSS